MRNWEFVIASSCGKVDPQAAIGRLSWWWYGGAAWRGDMDGDEIRSGAEISQDWDEFDNELFLQLPGRGEFCRSCDG